KAKGFGFVFIAEKDKGESVVAALNNTEIEGRRIKVDIANSKGGKGGRSGRTGGRGGSGEGKSSREMQALREEGEGGKKRKRRPRPKKD
ncbi:MAG TPA: RNA-binding protein, partial [Candidatus Poseidoniales archaeon]